MPKCTKCAEKAVFQSLCKTHFTSGFERKVVDTIKKYHLVGKGEQIIVGSSGGKDSTTILYILNKYFGNVTALAVDEGIPGYRNITLEDLKKFCIDNQIKLQIYSYKQVFGFSLHEALKVRRDVKPCNICGPLRRYILNTKARGYDKIATGHNLDDEAQSIMMNLIKAQMPLLSRLGPIAGNILDNKFVPRIKPLYFCAEKEVAAYAFIMRFGVRFSQCPHVKKSYRALIRDVINEYEMKHAGAKKAIVTNFIKILPTLKVNAPSKYSYCNNCGEVSSKDLCKACQLAKSISEDLNARGTKR